MNDPEENIVARFEQQLENRRIQREKVEKELRELRQRRQELSAQFQAGQERLAAHIQRLRQYADQQR